MSVEWKQMQPDVNKKDVWKLKESQQCVEVLVYPWTYSCVPTELPGLQLCNEKGRFIWWSVTKRAQTTLLWPSTASWLTEKELTCIPGRLPCTGEWAITKPSGLAPAAAAGNAGISSAPVVPDRPFYVSDSVGPSSAEQSPGVPSRLGLPCVPPMCRRGREKTTTLEYNSEQLSTLLTSANVEDQKSAILASQPPG